MRSHDFTTGSDVTLGSHTAAVRSVVYCPELRAVASGGWDKAVRVWDPSSRSSSSSSSSAAASSSAKVDVGERVYSMTMLHGSAAPTLVVATAGRQILTYDLRKLSSAGASSSSSSDATAGAGSSAGPLVSSRESSLKHQTRCIRSSPTGAFLAVSSTEGRVAIDYLAPESAAQSYAFKCHRKKEEGGGETVFPVHALAFHPVYGTFATGGGDGTVCTWDAYGRKRLSAIGPFPNPVAALAFSPDGASLAVAASYDFAMGEKEHAPDSIVVRNVADTEVKPKSAAAPPKA
jgi:cell cycle arrest protein BUB3